MSCCERQFCFPSFTCPAKQAQMRLLRPTTNSAGLGELWDVLSTARVRTWLEKLSILLLARISFLFSDIFVQSFWAFISISWYSSRSLHAPLHFLAEVIKTVCLLSFGQWCLTNYILTTVPAGRPLKSSFGKTISYKNQSSRNAGVIGKY